MSEQKKLPQYVAALIVTLGGFCAGTTIGWFSSADYLLKEKLKSSDDDISWISSILTLGAALANIIIYFLFDKIGRKMFLLILCLLLCASWILLVFANSIALYTVGRFFNGLFMGGFCAACPTYLAEFAHKSIRGQLGTLFQMQIVTAILVAYALVKANNLYILTVPLAIFPLVMFALVIFISESPVYLLKVGKEEKAKKALLFYRGKDYADIDTELEEFRNYAQSTKDEKFWDDFKKTANLKGLGMLIGMHLTQQLSGINVVIFYAYRLFQMAGSSMGSGDLSLVLGVVQFFCTLIAVFTVDKLGRRILWMVSLSVMAISLIIIGVYFLVQSNDEEKAKKIAGIPVAFINIYLAGFSFATGPLPWMMLGELLPSSMQSLASLISALNWLLAFVVTKTFITLVDAFGSYIVFWMYATFCILGLVFIIFFVIETKGKTLAEIQAKLGEKPET